MLSTSELVSCVKCVHGIYPDELDFNIHLVSNSTTTKLKKMHICMFSYFLFLFLFASWNKQLKLKVLIDLCSQGFFHRCAFK